MSFHVCFLLFLYFDRIYHLNLSKAKYMIIQKLKNGLIDDGSSTHRSHVHFIIRLWSNFPGIAQILWSPVDQTCFSFAATAVFCAITLE